MIIQKILRGHSPRFLYTFVALLLLPTMGFTQEGASPAASGFSAPITRETENVGYSEYPAQAEQLHANIEAAVAGVNSYNALPTSTVKVTLPLPKLENLSSAVKYYKRFHSACVTTQSKASSLCREKTSPQLQDIISQLSMVTMMMSSTIQDSCSKASKAMQLAQLGLTAYTSVCSAARLACASSCKTTMTNLTRIIQSDFEALKCTEASIPACQSYNTAISAMQSFSSASLNPTDANASDTKSIALKHQACTYDYPQMIASAATGAMSMMRSLAAAKQCKEQTQGDQAVDKCEDPEVAKSDAECICRFNPRTEGCANGYMKASTSGSSAMSSVAGKRVSPTNRGPSASATEDHEDLPAVDRGDSGGGAGSPSGGGSAGLGGIGGGKGGGAGADQGASGGRGINTNIYSGMAGGGGGGRSGGSGSSDSEAKYRAYLPGGKNDPSLGMAGQELWRKEVTGEGGKSNWEKVKDRYRDNGRSLISN